ncbi:MAG: hypothetical protein GXP26_16790 [Planctomycetes bacterium]|nr:hypothetical protein [Planctomycetota bacterium]
MTSPQPIRYILRVFSVAALTLIAVSNSAYAEASNLTIVKQAPNGHGLLCRLEGNPIPFLLVEGTPTQMGTAQGELLTKEANRLTERVLYMVGGVESLQGNKWFLNRMEEIQRRTLPHMPERFLEECDALALAAGMSQRDVRYANLFPERFHCSGVAVRGKASLDGRVYHARVLDYMRDINLQGMSAVVVFMPEKHHHWMSLGYAGFIGTVTAMNEHGLAIGEMGGKGEGLWDGMPMSFLLRDVMERASTVEEAVKIVRETPRTCEYYYVFSDRSGNMAGLYCTPDDVLVLAPGEQSEMLPLVPEDTVMFSAGSRAKKLSQRIQENYGKIDAQVMIDIIKRPVAMKSNLHNAVFAPETLDMWFANAGKFTPACDEPYIQCNLNSLISFYQENEPGKAAPSEKEQAQKQSRADKLASAGK